MQIRRCFLHPQQEIKYIVLNHQCQHFTRLVCTQCLDEFQLDYQRHGIQELSKIEQQLCKIFFPLIKDENVKQMIFDFYQTEFFTISDQYQKLREICKNSIDLIQSLVNKLDVLIQQVKLKQIVFVQQTFQFHKIKDLFTDLHQVKSKDVSSIIQQKVTDYFRYIRKLTPEQVHIQIQQQKQENSSDIESLQVDDMITSYQAIITAMRDLELRKVSKIPKPVHQQGCGTLLQTLEQIISKKHNEQLKAELVYNHKEDYEKVQFWSNLTGQPNTLVICKQKNSQYFGGYTPSQWQYGFPGKDPDLITFLFQCHGQELRVHTINRELKQRAINCGVKQMEFGQKNLVISTDFQRVEMKIFPGFSEQPDKYHVCQTITDEQDIFKVYVLKKIS
ncbi:unnamed protein product [Paramecium octaurelia]|uniref:TLDc domain-containing protein n=1 Tax=Paramecium octaurelia TaxID=43137 RepID=A0A8S1YDU1_PAROT|nr:unnamed protein product [Paramecium octaurelia]